jgi:uncharacterized protein with PIN domain
MFKICPAGHGEFQQRVTHCPDCGAALRLATSAEPPVRAVPVLPPAHELSCIERGDPRALREIAERFQTAGISCRIDGYPPDEPIRLGARRGSGVATSFGLYVLPADVEKAARLRTQHLQQSLPEAAGYAVAAGTELHECPACGEPLAEAARDCAACGLEFPEAGSEA